MFNGNLQRKPPDCHDKHLQIQTKPPYDILFGGRVGLTSLERRSTKLRKGFLFEVIFGTVFLISQPQGWELRNKGIQGTYVGFCKLIKSHIVLVVTTYSTYFISS